MNKGLDCFALTITIIGAINWGLIGFFSFDLVAWLFGNMTWGLYLISFYGHLSEK